MKTTVRKLLLWALRYLSESSSESQRLVCEECGGPIRKCDRYVILTARHRNCRDPRLVEPEGQLKFNIGGKSNDKS